MIEGEALAACKMCIHLLGQSAPIERFASKQQKQKGHFYANDIKVLLEICLRELTNIPSHDLTSLRLRFVFKSSHSIEMSQSVVHCCCL